ncbi:MAG: universal stress protein [Rhodospirillales bacterium]|nr:universal stress protein [Rhodospirillales bacterium]
MSCNSDPEATSRPPLARTFLCVVDESSELHQALRFACLRARKTGGRVALLYVIEPAEFQHWMAVRHLMEEEKREQAEELLQVVSAVVQKLSGTTPVVYIREGTLNEQLLDVINAETDISVLVLGAAESNEGPGQTVSYVMKNINKLRVPITIVPGNFTNNQIDSLA